MKLMRVKHKKIGWVVYTDDISAREACQKEIDMIDSADHDKPQEITGLAGIPPGWSDAIPWSYTQPIEDDCNANTKKILKHLSRRKAKR